METESKSIRCSCEDRLISFCPKCKSFYLVDEEGNREEVVLP